MGFLLEIADLRGTGFDDGLPADLLARAEEAAAALPRAGFSRALDRSFALPGATGAERVVVLGIGGSALGTRCVHEACRGPATKPVVVVDNIDPEALEQAWSSGDPARTAWVVVSKSGGTTETLAQCAVVRERLRALDAWGGAHVVTGPTGPLREMAGKEGLAVHDVPVEVGGRFSVFTPAATVPLALAGHDVEALLSGARAARDRCARPNGPAALLATLLAAAGLAGRNVVTLWSYAERLETLGEWFRQLWAESLGKQREDGTRVGQTPLHCVGSTDQHSIQQLMVEGPRDKVALVLAGPPTGATEVPADAPGPSAGHGLAGILSAMRRATTAGMVRAGCPAATLTLDRWDEASLGALLMTLLGATVVGGALFGVDPYGQPGVEAAKVATKDLLADPGGETDQSIRRLLREGEGLHCP